LLPVLHRSERWPAPVRPVTLVRPMDRAGPTGGYNSCTTNVLESLNDFSRPWNKNTPKTQPARKKNPSQNLAKQLQTDKELTSNSTTKRHTGQATHPRQIPQKGSHWSGRSLAPVRLVTPGQLGMNNTRGSKSSKSNSRSPDSLHGSKQDFGDSRNTSWALHSQVMAHQNSLNQEKLKDFRQEHTKP
jgi:hypothetical protein